MKTKENITTYNKIIYKIIFFHTIVHDMVRLQQQNIKHNENLKLKEREREREREREGYSIKHYCQ